MKSSKIISYLFAVILLLLLSMAAMAQTKTRVYPMPGDTIADHTFTDLVNYPKPSVNISDFRGKWLILDFWGFTCSSCIASFPRMNALAEQFKGQNVQLIMVAATKSSINGKNYEEVTKKMYRRQDMLYHLKFTNAFDSLLYGKMNVGGLPHILVIDPKGIIRAKTLHIDSTQLAALLAGKLPKFERSFSMNEPAGNDSYDKKAPLLTNNGSIVNGGYDTDYIYRSMLVPYDKATMPYFSLQDLTRIDFTKPINIEVFGYPIADLFRLAYFGKNFWSKKFNQEDYLKVLNETGNKALDKKLEEDRYAYSLRIPPTESIPSLLAVIQEDLKRVFPYRAKLETRNFPIYKITVNDAVKLNRLLKDKKDGKETKSEPYDGVWKVKNMDFNQFIDGLAKKMYVDGPVIEEIGVKNKFIDVDFQSDLQSKESIIKGMEKMGLKVELIQKPMRVLVLR